MSEHKIIPYEILLTVVENSSKVLEMVFPHELEILREFVKAIASTVRESIQKAEKGYPIIGHHFAFPGELFYAYDCVPVVLEATTYMLAALLTTGSEPFYDLADSKGHPYHSCTSQKGIIGMTMEDLFDFDVLAVPTAPCDNTMASYPVIQYFSNHAKMIVGDMPSYHSERGYQYFGGELQSMIDQLSNTLDAEPDYIKLRKCIDYNNRALSLLLEINELKRNVPSPYSSILCPAITGAYPIMSPKCKVAFLERVLEIGKRRYQQGKEIIGGERIRSVWPYMSIFFDIASCVWMDQVGINVLFDLFSYLHFDPIDTTLPKTELIYGLARQCLEYPMTRQSQGFADKMIEDTLFLSREFKADYAIFTAHLGCKQGVSLIQLVREALREELGIPMLTIDIDVGDKRMTSIQTVKKEVLTFIETLNLTH